MNDALTSDGTQTTDTHAELNDMTPHEFYDACKAGQFKARGD